jgi:hypothetical protein
MTGKCNKLIRGLRIATGTVLVGLGVVGIFLPLLPTTPFLLLAAALFAKSSERYYQWLLNNKWFGKYIRNYREGKGVPIRIKLMAISLIWITILLSFLLIDISWIRILLITIATGVSIHILLIR